MIGQIRDIIKHLSDGVNIQGADDVGLEVSGAYMWPIPGVYGRFVTFIRPQAHIY